MVSGGALMWHYPYVVYEPQEVLAAKSTTAASRFTTLAAIPSLSSSKSLLPTSTASFPSHTISSAPGVSPNSRPKVGKGSIAGIALGLAIIFVILGTIALLKRRRKLGKPSQQPSAAELEGHANSVWKWFINGEWRSEKDGNEITGKGRGPNIAPVELDGSQMRAELEATARTIDDCASRRSDPHVEATTPSIATVRKHSQVRDREIADIRNLEMRATVAEHDLLENEVLESGSTAAIRRKPVVHEKGPKGNERDISGAYVTERKEAEDAELELIIQEEQRLQERKRKILEKKGL